MSRSFGIDKFFDSVAASERQDQLDRQAEKVKQDFAADAAARAAAPPKLQNKRGPKPKLRSLHHPAEKRARNVRTAKHKPASNPNRCKPKINWWHPLTHTEIIEAVRQHGGVDGAVKHLRQKNRRVYKHLEQRTVKGWFENYKAGGPYVLTEFAVKAAKAGYPTRVTKGQSRRALDDVRATLTDAICSTCLKGCIGYTAVIYYGASSQFVWHFAYLMPCFCHFGLQSGTWLQQPQG